MASSPDEPTEETQEELNKLDAIRELLFGQNVKEYRDEIHILKEELSNTEKGQNKRMEESYENLVKKLEDLSRKMDSRLSKIEQQLTDLSETKVDKKALANAFGPLTKGIDS